MARCQAKLLRLSRALVIAALAASAARPGLASAQAPNRAAQLFEAGVADLKLGKYETACASLEESHGLDENLGTLIALGDCLERWGKPHSAVLRFEQLIAAVSGANGKASVHRAPQLEYARAAVARLGPSIPRLRLGFAPSFDAGAAVLLDGRPLEPSPPEQEIGLDPGRHVIEAQAAGREPWRLELELAPGERRRVEVELGQRLDPEPPPPLATALTTSPALPSEPARAAAPGAEPGAEGNAWRTVGWGLGGLGVAGIGAGAVAGVLLLKECPGFDCAARDRRARDLALVTDIGFGVGVAALAASAILLLSTSAPTKDAGKSADADAWRPLASCDARGGWLGVSHSF